MMIVAHCDAGTSLGPLVIVIIAVLVGTLHGQPMKETSDMMSLYTGRDNRHEIIF